MEKVIDATNKKLGRVATEAAMALMGKDQANYQPNKLAEVTVVIENAAKTSISEKKKGEKEYAKYSGYPGGLKFETLNKILIEKGVEEVYRKAVYGMLPSNRLRSPRMKNLIVKD
jgi:large subunit ribosomal protein L13